METNKKHRQMSITLPGGTVFTQKGESGVLYGLKGKKHIFKFEMPGHWAWWIGSGTGVTILFIEIEVDS